VTPQNPSHPERPGGTRTGLLVVGALIVASVPLALASHSLFLRSEDELSQVRVRMEDLGRSVDPMGCVSAVLDWRPNCGALKGLCDRSVPELVYACMGAQDRAEYCEGIQKDTDSTSFGFGDCQARGFGRRAGSCAGAWRAVANFCTGRAPTRWM
jgi:hypothetical protein